MDWIERARRQSVMSKRWHVQVNVIAASFLVSDELRLSLLRRAGLDLGEVDIRPGCFFFGSDVHMADGSRAHNGCYFDSRAPIHMGRNAAAAAQVMFLTSSHEYGPPEQRTGPFVCEPIHVDDGAWVGARCLLLPGAHVGAGCIVTAGSVVFGELKPNGLYAGFPARRVRELDGAEQDAA